MARGDHKNRDNALMMAHDVAKDAATATQIMATPMVSLFLVGDSM